MYIPVSKQMLICLGNGCSKIFYEKTDDRSLALFTVLSIPKVRYHITCKYI